MIPKAERDADKAICEMAEKAPWVRRDDCGGRGVSKPGEDGSDDFIVELGSNGSDEDLDFIVTARNRLPLYIADAEEMERRIAAVKARAQEYAASEERADRQHAAGMREALKILRGEE